MHPLPAIALVLTALLLSVSYPRRAVLMLDFVAVVAGWVAWKGKECHE